MAKEKELLTMCEQISEEKCRNAFKFCVKQSARGEEYTLTEQTLYNMLSHIITLESP